MSPIESRFQVLLDRIAAGEAVDDLLRTIVEDAELAPSEAADLAADLRLAAALRQTLPIRMPAGRRASMQAQLQSALADLRPAESEPTRRAWSRLALRFGALLVAISLALGSAVVTSAESLPGDLLYPVKRVAEGARLALALGPAGRLRVRLDIAAARLDELQQLSDRGAAVPAELLDALLEAHAALLNGVDAAEDPSLLEELRRQAEQHQGVIQALRADADPAARPTFEAAEAALEALRATAKARAGERRPTATLLSRPQPARSPTPSGLALPPSLEPPASATPAPIRGIAAATPSLPPMRATVSALLTQQPPQLEATLRAMRGVRQTDEAGRMATRQAHIAGATATAEAIRLRREAARATHQAENKATKEAVIKATRAAAGTATREARATERARFTPAPNETRVVAPEPTRTPPTRPTRTHEPTATEPPARDTPATPSDKPTATEGPADTPTPEPSLEPTP